MPTPKPTPDTPVVVDVLPTDSAAAFAPEPTPDLEIDSERGSYLVTLGDWRTDVFDPSDVDLPLVHRGGVQCTKAVATRLQDLAASYDVVLNVTKKETS